MLCKRFSLGPIRFILLKLLPTRDIFDSVFSLIKFNKIFQGFWIGQTNQQCMYSFSPNFEEKDVVELFAQVKEDYGEIFDDRIPIDIFERTSGHRGLTGFCGKFLHEFLWKGKDVVTYEEWIRSASQLLLDRLPKWPTMQKLVETLQNPISEKPRTLLLTHFLPSSSPVKVTPQEDKLARFLTAEGALVNTEDDRVCSSISTCSKFLLNE
jgi:hypothetical protein